MDKKKQQKSLIPNSFGKHYPIDIHGTKLKEKIAFFYHLDQHGTRITQRIKYFSYKSSLLNGERVHILNYS